MNRKTTLALLVALLGTGCSSALLSGRDTQPEELAEIKSRILELQRTAAMTRVEIDRLRQQVVTLESRLGASAGPVSTAPAPPPREPAAPVTPQPAPSRVEVTDLEVAPPRTAAPRTPPASSPTPPDASTATQPSLPPVVPPREPAPAVSGPTAPVSEAAQALYDRGYTLYHQGRFVDAEAGFRRFLQAYPDTSLSDNAQYWIGESRFARGDYDGALAAFREAAERYPGGNKVADSLLKAADCLRQLGESSSARAAYDEVIRRFPGSAAAAMAEERRGQL